MFRRHNVVDERDLTEAVERAGGLPRGRGERTADHRLSRAFDAARRECFPQNTDNRGMSAVATAGSPAVSS